MLIKDQAHRYKELNAPERRNFISDSKSFSKGFGIEGTQPNTVHGVLHNGHTNDYVVLEGRFSYKEKSDTIQYYFTDAAGDTIAVDISKSNNAAPPIPDLNYYLWGQVQQSFFSTSINVIEFTPMG